MGRPGAGGGGAGTEWPERGEEEGEEAGEGEGCGANGAPSPQTSLLLLLLLLLSPGLCGTPDCSFRHSPISSTFVDTIRKLVSAPAAPAAVLSGGARSPSPRPLAIGQPS